MIPIPQLIVAWLNADSAIQAAVSGRISTVLEPGSGFPAIVIGPVSGGPIAMPQASVDRIEGEGEALQEAVAEGYREVARLFPDRIALIPAAGTLDEVHTRVLAAVIGGT